MNNFKPASTPVTEGCIAVAFCSGLVETVLAIWSHRGVWRVISLRTSRYYNLRESNLMCIGGYDETQDRKFDHQG